MLRVLPHGPSSRKSLPVSKVCTSVGVYVDSGGRSIHIIYLVENLNSNFYLNRTTSIYVRKSTPNAKEAVMLLYYWINIISAKHLSGLLRSSSSEKFIYCWVIL